MESITPDARFSQWRGESNHLGYFRTRGVKLGIEGTDLEQIRPALKTQTNGLQVVRLMKRRERNEDLQLIDDSAVEAHGVGVLQSPCATRWPMPISRMPLSSLRRNP